MPKSVVTGALQAAALVVKDPCLPVVIREVKALKIKGKPGVGLCSVVKPIRAYAYYQKNPWIIWAGAAGILAFTFYLGRASK
jgi:hypothetical protein